MDQDRAESAWVRLEHDGKLYGELHTSGMALRIKRGVYRVIFDLSDPRHVHSDRVVRFSDRENPIDETDKLV